MEENQYEIREHMIVRELLLRLVNGLLKMYLLNNIQWVGIMDIKKIAISEIV